MAGGNRRGENGGESEMSAKAGENEMKTSAAKMAGEMKIEKQ
jgi:hypothetical protein